MNLGVTGTKNGPTALQWRVASEWLETQTSHIYQLHHGCCIGVDEWLARQGEALGIPLYHHPPVMQDKTFNYEALPGKSSDWLPFLDRNHAIVDATDTLLALPKEMFGEQLRSGTWATVRYARKQHKTVVIIRPDGAIEYEGNS